MENVKMSLTKKTMIVNLQIEMLGTSAKDNSTTKVVNSHLQATNSAGYYKKCKIDADSIRPVKSAADTARRIHKDLTRPFGDDGWRLLPATRVLEYTREMRDAKQNFIFAVKDLEVMWPTIIAKQKTRLNSIKHNLFNPEDYPFVEADNDPNNQATYKILPNVDLSKFYTIHFELQPTPDAGNFVIELEAETIAEIKETLKEQNRQKLEDSKLELWRRLIEPVKNMAKICTEDKKVFASLTANIEKELKILSDLNVTNDIDLTLAMDEVKKSLTGYTPGQIREDKRLKKDLGTKATMLTSKISHMSTGTKPN